MWIRLQAGVIGTGVSMVLMVSAVPAMAAPLGTGPVCDRESPYQICLSVNGTSGDDVYGKTYSTDHEEHTTVAAANVCNGTDVVDGNNSTCPFSSGSAHLNDKYAGRLIVQMHNTVENNVYYRGKIAKMFQGAQGAGYEWVLAPVSPGSSIYYLISVAASSADQTSWFACSLGANQGIAVTSIFQGGGACEWSFP